MSDKRFWYDMAGDCADVVISSRVRLARNFADLPFPNKMNKEQRVRLMDQTEKTLIGKVKHLPLRSVRTADLKPMFLAELAENHIISRDFCTGEDKMLIFTEDESAAVMVGEEDHVRIQVFRPGLDLRGCFETACSVDDALNQEIPMAFDSEWGYLTQCPTNLGTGMRASVMVHLPALERNRELGEIINSLNKLGFTIRGTYGEGTEAKGCLYQISNQITLGVSEEDTIDDLESVIRQIIQMEKDARQKMKNDATADTVYRSLGILRYARVMSSAELYKLLSHVRLGISLGYITDISYETCNKLSAQTTAAAIINRAGEELQPAQRDIRRADLVRSFLG